MMSGAKRSSHPPKRGGFCPSCGSETASGDRYCRACGQALQGEGKGGSPAGLTLLRNAGVAVIVAAVLFAIFYYGRRDAQQETPAERIPIGQVGSGAAPDQPMTPREAADEIFNQAMTAYETGDSAAAARFIPMALTAYRGLASLDLDARYHMALLSLAADLPDEAIAQADTMLAEVPEHLLTRSAAARAYERLGDTTRTAELYRRYLDAYTPEAAASRPEYMDHRSLLPALQERAQQYLQNQGGGSQ